MTGNDLHADNISIAGPHEPLLGPTSFEAPGGEVTVVTGDPGPTQKALALALGGRVALMTGSIRLGHTSNASDLRRRVRLVDVPDVSEPDGALPVHAVIAEELALADQPSRKADVQRVLDGAGLGDARSQRWEQQPPGARTALLVRLAAGAPHTDVLVITAPDRHGGDPDLWYAAATEAADDGLTVIVLCGAPTAARLHLTDPISLGALA